MAAVRLIAKVPDARGLLLLPQPRPALRLSRQRPQLRRELPLDDVQEDRAQVRAGPAAGEGARRALHPPRRPRAELLDQRRAQRRLLAGGSLLGGRRRCRGPLRARCTAGANEAVLRMLRRIETVDNIPGFLEGVKNREEKLMGFGHRVYKNYDPRARIIKKHVEEVLEATEPSPLLEIATELEKRALDDDFFTSRKLYPNVDFYSGPDLRGARAAERDVHGDVRHPAHLGLGRPVAGDARRPGDEDRPPAPDLHRAARRRLRRRSTERDGPEKITNDALRRPIRQRRGA